jgi:hypothetical protein
MDYSEAVVRRGLLGLFCKPPATVIPALLSGFLLRLGISVSAPGVHIRIPRFHFSPPSSGNVIFSYKGGGSSNPEIFLPRTSSVDSSRYAPGSTPPFWCHPALRLAHQSPGVFRGRTPCHPRTTGVCLAALHRELSRSLRPQGLGRPRK